MLREQFAKFDWIVSRPRIHSLLRAGMEYPLVTVVAGPGYGKTTAVVDFCRGTDRRLIWFHLLPADNDPDRFWHGFAEAFARDFPQLSQSLQVIKFPDSHGEFDAFLRIFTRELLKNGRVLAVLDNAQIITSAGVRRFIDNLIKAELENLCIIFIANERPHLLGLIGDGRHFQIGANELRFNEQEIAQLFNYYGHSPGEAELANIYDYTDGWPLALHLIASQAANSAPAGYVGSPPLQVIAELFEHHYFSNFDPEWQKLLIKLSFFRRIFLGLVQALGVPEIVTAIEKFSQHIFISYDYTARYYYFQEMYRSFLVSKQDTLSREETTDALTRAIDWYHQNGYYQEALDCVSLVHDYDRFIQIVLDVPKIRRGVRATNKLLRQLNQIPQAYREAHEVVDYCRGFMYLNDVRIRKAKEIFLDLVRRLEAAHDEEKQTLLGETYAVLMDISQLQNNTDALDYAKKALPLLPHGSRVRTYDVRVVGNNEIFFLPDNGPGQVDRICGYMFEFCEYTKDFYGDSGRGYPHLFAAEGYYHTGRFEQVWEQCLRAIHVARDAHQPDIASNAMFLQVRMALFHGDHVRAENLLGELTEYIDGNGLTDLYPLRDCARALFYLHMNDIDKAPPWFFQCDGVATDTPLETGRDKIICAVCRFAVGDVEGSYSALLELDDILEERGLWGTRLHAYILKAVCLLRIGQEARAMEKLWAAHEMSWQNGATTCFAEYGNNILPLLEAARRQDGYAFQPQWLERIAREAAEFAHRRSATIKQYGGNLLVHRSRLPELTPREKEVMRYLSQSLTREEISAMLGITLHGVKKHITNIYNKLGAVNRVDAIHIVEAYGILEND